MGILYGILIGITALVGLVLLLGLIVKKDYLITRTIVIEKPTPDVFNFIKLVKNQELFNKWVMVDPNMKKDLRGTDGTVGFVYAWDGNNKAGQGEQEIKGIVEGARVEHEIRFVRPFSGIAQAIIAVEAVANATKLSWTFNSAMKYPMNAMFVFISPDKLLGRDMEISLGNLKNILEKK